MLTIYADRRPGFSVMAAGDAEVIASPVDFLGVNFYFPQIVAHPSRVAEARSAGFAVRSGAGDHMDAELGAVAAERPDQPRTAMGWEVEAGALTELLVRVRQDYTRGPVYITENGAACDDYVDPDGRVVDQDRIDYLDAHLHALAGAMDAGVDVRGYFVWSLMDNYEWSNGYSKRFGVTWVDYPSGRRIRKASFDWYRGVAAANRLPSSS